MNTLRTLLIVLPIILSIAGCISKVGSVVNTSAYDVLNKNGGEEPLYGLYSYVLLPTLSADGRAFIDNLVDNTMPAKGSMVDRQRINVFYIPAASKASAAKKPLSDYYNYNLASALLSDICANKDMRPSSCVGAMSGGPYLFSYPVPFSNQPSISQPYLFLDLTGVHPKAYPQFIDAYKAQVKRDDFTDREKLDTLRLAILNITLKAGDTTGPVQKAVADMVEISK